MSSSTGPKLSSTPSVWIASNGNYGCIPDNFQVCTRKADAIAYVIELFGLHGRRSATFKRDLYIDLKPEDGAAYAEVYALYGEEAREALGEMDL